MLQNARVTAFTISELLRENQQGEAKLPSTTARVNLVLSPVKQSFADVLQNKVLLKIPQNLQENTC